MSYVSSVQSYGAPLRPPLPQVGVDAPPGERLAPTRASDALPPEPEPAAARAAPSDIGARIGDLIAEQVSSGALDTEQAETLRSLFAGPSDGRRADLVAGDSASSSSLLRPTIETDRQGASSGRDAADADRDAAVRQFVDQLRQSLASGYSAGGAATRAARPLAFDLSA